MSAAGSEAGSDRSLLGRAGLLMGLIVLLTVVGMGGSVVVTETARGDAAAINAAGSLRMAAYRAAARAGQTPLPEAVGEGFQQRLEAPVLLRALESDATVRALHAEIGAEWQREISPALERVAAGDLPLATVWPTLGGFVARVDGLVTALQRNAESRIQLMRVVQGSALFVILLLAAYAMQQLATDVLPPLRRLIEAVRAARDGDLGVRVPYSGRNEIGLLASTYNHMANELQSLHAELDRRVRDRTQRLEQSNRALRLLSDSAWQLASHDLDERERQGLEKELGALLGNDNVSVSLDERHTPFQTTANDPAGPPHSTVPMQTFAVTFGGTRYGTLHVPRKLEAWQIRLCRAFAALLGSACQRHEREAERHRLALMDERAIIARELHDSIAQSLSYLKIQITRMEHALRAGSDPTPIAGDFRRELNRAYGQLRELIDTFRLRLTESGLNTAVHAALAEFEARAGYAADASIELPDDWLSPAEELHLVQILREALSNVAQHARADTCDVALEHGSDGRVRMSVADNGAGLTGHSLAQGHYGTSIMQERAAALGGCIHFETPETGGTRVRVVFRPNASRREVAS